MKIKFTVEQAQRGSRGIALLFPQPQRWMGLGGQRHAPAAFPPEKTPYLLYRRPDGAQGRSGRVRKILPPTGIRSPDRSARSESLCRLHYAVPQEMESGQIQDPGRRSLKTAGRH